MKNETNHTHTPTCKKANGKQTQYDLDCKRCNKDSYDSVTALRPVAEKFFEAQHTPTSWIISENGERTRDLEEVAFYAGPNAAFIVRAVNAHQNLIDVMTEIIRWADTVDAPYKDRAISIMKQALAKAEGL